MKTKRSFLRKFFSKAAPVRLRDFYKRYKFILLLAAWLAIAIACGIGGWFLAGVAAKVLWTICVAMILIPAIGFYFLSKTTNFH